MEHQSSNFDAVRLIAAGVVIFGHSHPLTQHPDAAFMGNSVEAFAVKIFFVISGYLITASWISDPDIFRYLCKRGLRILPGLTLVVLLCAFVLGPFVTRLSIPEYLLNARLRHYLLNLALFPCYDLPGVFEKLAFPVAVNGSLWSLPVEFFMYLVTPLLVTANLRSGGRWLLIVVTIFACAFSLWYLRVPPQPPSFALYGTNFNSALDVMPWFLIGSCYRVHGAARFLEPGFALGLLGIVILLPPDGAVLEEMVLYIVAPYAILSFASSSSWGFSDAGKWGDFSYGLYLFGFPVQQAVNYFLGNDLTPVENTILSFPLALAFAVASWHLVEKRALAHKPSALKRSLGVPIQKVDA